MAFKENAKVKDYAQAQVVTVKKYRCPECGWITRDVQEWRQHVCVGGFAELDGEQERRVNGYKEEGYTTE
jgi:hypothetical protein